MKNQTFRTIIEPDTTGFHGYVPALRGCHTWGSTIAKTRAHLREAMEVHIESLLAHGEPVPTDDSFESFETIAVKSAPRVRSRSGVRQYA